MSRAEGFYARYVLPHVIDLVMRDKEAARLRAAWVPKARGDVLEVGIGSGLNLRYYSDQVKRVLGVDPSTGLRKMAEERAAAAHVHVDLLPQSAEGALPIEDRSIDTVVMTWTLCSIPDPSAALGEIKRVLKPEGQMIFVEHGRAPDAGVVVWQDRITPIWKRIGGGCHLNRSIDSLIEGAGFRLAEFTTGYLPGPRPMTYTYQGLARPLPS
jgi:ubiquinone/menaquinone biosynthesis C-methylase UbiE